MASKISKDVEHALKWLAREFIFLQKLHEDLEKIENDKLEDQQKELAKDGRVIKFIQRAEERVDKDIRAILNEMHAASFQSISAPEVKALLDQIKIPADKLLLEGARYVGELRQQLNTIRTNVDIEKKYPNQTELQQVVRAGLKKLNAKVEDIIM